jgi:hypothetical protein
VFKRKALRIFAGILLGSSAGVLWAVFFHSRHSAAFAFEDETARQLALLYSTMIGACSGFIIGLAVGLARNSTATMIAALVSAPVLALLPFGLFVFKPGSVHEGLIAAAAVLLAIAVAFAVALPPPSSPEGSELD